jgi:hypothetical protein
VVPIVKPAVRQLQELTVVVASWDTKVEKETLTKLDVRLRYAVLKKENLKPVLIAQIIQYAKLYLAFMIKVDINIKNTSNQ